MTDIYTLWARLPRDDGAWMIAAEDEFCWEGNPDRCEATFAMARENAEAEGNVVREVVIHVDQEAIEASFRAAETTGTVTS